MIPPIQTFSAPTPGKEATVIPSEGYLLVELRFDVEIGPDCHLTLHWFRWACDDHLFGLYQLRPVGEHFWTLKSSLSFPVSPLCQVFPRKSGSSFPFRLSNHNEICKASHQAKQQAAPDHSGEQGTGGMSEGNGAGFRPGPRGARQRPPFQAWMWAPSFFKCSVNTNAEKSSSSSSP